MLVIIHLIVIKQGENNMMEIPVHEYIATKYGLKVAIIAQYFWNRIEAEKGTEKMKKAEGKYWCRCSMIMLTGYFPFLTKQMVRDAIGTLIKKNVIRKGVFNAEKFDRTSWYTFTEYGKHLMEKEEYNDGKKISTSYSE